MNNAIKQELAQVFYKLYVETAVIWYLEAYHEVMKGQ